MTSRLYLSQELNSRKKEGLVVSNCCWLRTRLLHFSPLHLHPSIPGLFLECLTKFLLPYPPQTIIFNISLHLRPPPSFPPSGHSFVSSWCASPSVRRPLTPPQSMFLCCGVRIHRHQLHLVRFVRFSSFYRNFILLQFLIKFFFLFFLQLWLCIPFTDPHRLCVHCFRNLSKGFADRKNMAGR